MLKYSIKGDVLCSDGNMKLDGNEMPGEDALLKAYQKAIHRASPRPLIVHMKQRIQESDIFNDDLQTHLRALLRVSAYGTLRILFSAISCVEEMVAAKIAVADARQSLALAGVAYDESIPLGIAVDTPSAAILSDVLARECDFFIIDIQNLIRHSLGYNYADQQIHEQEARYNPSIFILMKCAIDGAHKAGLNCGITGEAVEEFRLLPALLGLGVDELYLSKDKIDHAREILSQRSGESYRELASSLLMAGTRSEVMELLGSVGNPARYAGRTPSNDQGKSVFRQF